ncbi:MAG: Fur family transcriptional regulator [Leucobacter sp.]
MTTATRPAPPRQSRSTHQKEIIRRALDENEGFISAQQLHRRLTEEGNHVGIATVYRRLNALAESGDADTITATGEQLFRTCKPGSHHHHLVCENCGRAVDIDPPHEDWIAATAEQNGFTVTRHVLEIFGLCAQCQNPA